METGATPVLRLLDRPIKPPRKIARAKIEQVEQIRWRHVRAQCSPAGKIRRRLQDVALPSEARELQLELAVDEPQIGSEKRRRHVVARIELALRHDLLRQR